MKLLIVTQYFYPENFRINDLAMELKQRGHGITVFTGQPNYPEGDFYDGYGFFAPQKENWNGIDIIRSPLFPRKKGALHLVLNYFSFAFLASWKAGFYPFDNYDAIYVFETSPITVAFPAIVIKNRKKLPLIMNVQDLWPENVMAVTNCTSPFIVKPLEIMVKHIYKNCDMILAASRSFVPNIQSYLKGKEKERVIFWPQYATIKPASEDKHFLDTSYCNFVFTGNLGEAQGLEMMAEAAEILKDTNIRWHLVGDGRNRKFLETDIHSRGLGEHVIFHGRKPEQLIPYYLCNADAALLILKPSPVFDMTIPAKLQTYLACGVPILGCVGGESKRLIEEEGVGLACSSVTSEELARLAFIFCEMPEDKKKRFQRNAANCSKKYFSKDTLVKQLENYIEELRK